MKVLPLVAMACLLMACSKLTVENYDKLKTGMAYEETVRILGTPTTCDEVLGIKSCVWGNGPSRISVNFLGGKIVVTTAENIH